MTCFTEPAGKIAFEKFVKKFMGLQPDETAVEGALKQVNAFFDVAERELQGREYMVGKEFTLVDIWYIPLIRRLFACGYGDVVLSRKAVSAWWDRCTSRRAIQQMLAADEEAMRAARK
jgi:glutathione S-transferase